MMLRLLSPANNHFSAYSIILLLLALGRFSRRAVQRTAGRLSTKNPVEIERRLAFLPSGGQNQDQDRSTCAGELPQRCPERDGGINYRKIMQ